VNTKKRQSKEQYIEIEHLQTKNGKWDGWVENWLLSSNWDPRSYCVELCIHSSIHPQCCTSS